MNLLIIFATLFSALPAARAADAPDAPNPGLRSLLDQQPAEVVGAGPFQDQRENLLEAEGLGEVEPGVLLLEETDGLKAAPAGVAGDRLGLLRGSVGQVRLVPISAHP